MANIIISDLEPKIEEVNENETQSIKGGGFQTGGTGLVTENLSLKPRPSRTALQF